MVKLLWGFNSCFVSDDDKPFIGELAMHYRTVYNCPTLLLLLLLVNLTSSEVSHGATDSLFIFTGPGRVSDSAP